MSVRTPALFKRLRYRRYEPRPESGLWLFPAMLLILGAWVLAWAALASR